MRPWWEVDVASFGRLLGRGARWAAPGRSHHLGLLVAVAGVIGVAAWLHHRVLGSPSPEETLARAYGFLAGPLPLEGAQDEAWRLSVRDGGGLTGQTDVLLSPPLPPPLCLPEQDDADVRAVNGAIRRVDDAMRAEDAAGVEEALGALAEGELFLPAGGSAWVRLALARGYAWGRDLGAAAGILEGAELAGVEGGAVPIVAAATAARLFEGDRVSREQVVLAFHLRYLAGLVAHRRGRPGEAIAHFRRALNAVNYVITPDRTLRSGGHYQRTSMEPGGLRCGGRGDDLTSLDAYTGLVAAYMSARDFRDPTRLAREVDRRAYEVDPDDPLTPLLVHAQDVARGGGDSPIPEHVFWASSNLQRVYHYNRLRPDRRLALTRAVLTLRILDDRDWTAALGVDQDETCDMLAGLGRSLYQDSSRPGAGDGPRTMGDSAWAAVAVHTFARLELQCPDAAAPDLSADVKSRWLRLGGGLLHAGLVARYEAFRATLERGGGAAPDVAAREIVRRVESDLRFFSTGRIPPDLSVALEPAMAAEFVDAWQQAIFRGVAHHLISGIDSGTPGIPGGRVRAGDAGAYLRTVNAAVYHGGRTPMDAYRPDALAILARSGGPTGSAAYQLGYVARSYPRASLAALVFLTGAALVVLLLGFVSWWRFSLLTRRDFYAMESGRRGEVAYSVPPAGPVDGRDDS